jgi:alanine racemase
MTILQTEREAVSHEKTDHCKAGGQAERGCSQGKGGSAVIYAVLAADASGAGLTEMAEILRGEGIGRFAVSEPEEAAALREAGFVDEEILMLRSTTDREELERLLDLNAICTIGSYDTGVALNALAEARATVAEAHLQVDTGMGFGGFLSGEPEKILSMYRYLPNVALSGIYTQIHGKRHGEHTAADQVEEFQKVTKIIHEAGFETGVVHAAGSYALMRYPFAALDGVRVGSAFLGRGRRRKDDGLCRVGYGEAALNEVRWLPKGHMVGNDVPVMLKKPTRVAVLPVGYQNGLGMSWRRDEGLVAALRQQVCGNF